MSWVNYILFFTAGAALACDPQTQYHKEDGQCCTKCPPGTRMSDETNCLDPLCKPCDVDEYRMGRTVEKKCDLQPYCDPNKNMVHDGPVTKEKLSVCRCRDGFHCPTEACITCVAHSLCAAGQRVKDKGNHSLDTVCQDCPPNTFSSGEPADSDCHDWTVCEPGHVKKDGTTTSDAICESTHRHHVFLIIPILIILALFAFAYWKLRGNEDKKQSFEELGTTDAPVPIHGPEVAITLPEENDYPLVRPQPPMGTNGGPPVTDNGRVVAQERGKGSVVPQQESHDPLLLINPFDELQPCYLSKAALT
ncbi:unnamed protein product [Gadus morhua 'NCC']